MQISVYVELFSYRGKYVRFYRNPELERAYVASVGGGCGVLMAILRSYYRTFRTALHGLRRHMMRSVLSGLGIVIGVAAVIAMMEIGQGSSYIIRGWCK